MPSDKIDTSDVLKRLQQEISEIQGVQEMKEGVKQAPEPAVQDIDPVTPAQVAARQTARGPGTPMLKARLREGRNVAPEEGQLMPQPSQIQMDDGKDDALPPMLRGVVDMERRKLLKKEPGGWEREKRRQEKWRYRELMGRPQRRPIMDKDGKPTGGSTSNVG